MEIRTRLTLQFFLMVATILMVSFFFIYFIIEQNRQNSFYERLNNKAITAAELLFRVDRVDSSLLKLIDRTERDRLFFENISIFNFENRVIYTNNDSIQDSKHLGISPKRLNEIRMEGRKEFQFKEYELLGLKYRFRNRTYVVIAGAVDIYGNNQRQSLRFTMLFLFFGILVLVSATGWIYAGRVLKPISNVVNEVDQMSPDNLSARLKPLENTDEIGRLVLTINRLLKRIEDAFNLQRIFVAGASHELKNPLSVITSQLEVSLLKERSVNEYKETLSSVLIDIKRLNRITIQLMELARLSHDFNSIPLELTRVDEVLWDACKNLVQKNPDYKVEQSITSLPEDESLLCIPGNGPLLATAFENLAENACKYSSDNRVVVVLSNYPDHLEILFEDRGEGIAETDMQLIYEPFFRSSSTQSIKGTGLGLALVEKILKIHKAEIAIESIKGKGTKIRIRFPHKI